VHRSYEVTNPKFKIVIDAATQTMGKSGPTGKG
jgi:hypothetical protein